ncbi:rhomboid family intramembrane serine protease [Candidatus Woesearchaeota archaeon]|nr:rhomboid family intramembrane serine protease [Candidatus Woesearchaeota archaeon]
MGKKDKYLLNSSQRSLMEPIRSETRFVWALLRGVLLAPLALVLMLFGKRKLSDVLSPFKELFLFVTEPKLTITLITINIFVFILAGFLPVEIVSKGALSPSTAVEFYFLPLLTAGFLHANLLHLFSNMLGIFIFGRVVEREIGAAKMIGAYFGAMIISGLFHIGIYRFYFQQDASGIGASGALMGLVAMAILLDPLYLTYEFLVPLPIMVVGWLAIYADITGIISNAADGIGHFAHLGGFLSAAIFGFILNFEQKKKRRLGLIINIASLALWILIAYFLKYKGMLPG